MRYFVELSFNGKNYHGWQIQPDQVTVQQVIEKALSVLLRQTIRVTGCGRTDAGVHASQFYLHFDIEKIIEKEKLKYRLNSFLPDDIAVHYIHSVKKDSHARFDASSRSYEYRISTEKDVFLNEFSSRIDKGQVDIDSMNRAAALLLGNHNFKCFSRSNTDVKTFNCEVTEAVWKSNNDVLIFHISANRFLRNMVRAIVGTLIEVGRQKMTLTEFKEILLNQDRTQAGASAKAKGLFLTKVIYPKDIFIK